MAKINKIVELYKEKLNGFTGLFFQDIFTDEGGKLKQFINLFDNVTDSRMILKCKYSTKFIVVMVFLAFLDMRETWQEIADFAEDKRFFLKNFIEYPDTLPVHDTYMRVFSKIHSSTLENTIIEFLKDCINLVVDKNVKKNDGSLDIIAIDGKELRGSGRLYNTDAKKKNAQIMHFWDVSNQLCLKSVVIDEKTNEIPTAQKILSTLEIKNKIITADAMNCQKKTVEIIVKNKAHYILALKNNHNEFYNDIDKYFKENLNTIRTEGDYYKMEIEKNHNQVETREFFRINADLFYQESEWLNLKSIVCYRKKIYKLHTQIESYEYRYYISDLKDLETISLGIRSHWSVENQLHYVLDTFLMKMLIRL